MKTITFLQVAALGATLALASCKKSEDVTPASAVVELPSNVIGSFTGQLGYNSSPIPIANTSGTATLTKTGDKTYSIAFSDGVPAITNLKFQTAASGSYATVASDGSTAGMTLSATSLSVGVTKGTQTWAFTGDK